MRKFFTSLVLAAVLGSAIGCSNPLQMDPATTVVVKINGNTTANQRDGIQEAAVELVKENSLWHKMRMTDANGNAMEIQLSPVTEVQAFADKIKFGKVTSVDGNVIQVDVP